MTSLDAQLQLLKASFADYENFCRTVIFQISGTLTACEKNEKILECEHILLVNDKFLKLEC